MCVGNVSKIKHAPDIHRNALPFSRCVVALLIVNGTTTYLLTQTKMHGVAAQCGLVQHIWKMGQRIFPAFLMNGLPNVREQSLTLTSDITGVFTLAFHYPPPHLSANLCIFTPSQYNINKTKDKSKEGSKLYSPASPQTTKSTYLKICVKTGV